MTLEERIKQMLEESTKQVEVTQEVVAEEKQVELKSLSEEDLEAMTQEEFDAIDEEQLDELSKKMLVNYVKKSSADAEGNKHVINSELQSSYSNRTKGMAAATKKLTKESSGVSDQVASLLEAEGLSEEFKAQAVTIFEAAVTDRVLQIQESLEAEYNEKLDEARAEIETNIDGFLNEAVQEWAKNNEVAIQSNFKTRLAESFMDGLQSLLAEHNIDLPAESENALDIALEEVSKLEEAADEVQTTIAQLQEEVNTLKAEKILESFKEKMTVTEFDRFAQLTESVKFKDETQYEKQLNVVLENFGKITQKQTEVAKPTEEIVDQIVEDTLVQTAPIITETFSSVNRYAQYFASKAK